MKLKIVRFIPRRRFRVEEIPSNRHDDKWKSVSGLFLLLILGKFHCISSLRWKVHPREGFFWRETRRYGDGQGTRVSMLSRTVTQLCRRYQGGFEKNNKAELSSERKIHLI